MKQPEKKYLKDYKAPSYFIDTIDLDVEIFNDFTTVKSLMKVRRNKNVANKNTPLLLDGKDLELISISMDNSAIFGDIYQKTDEVLTIFKVPDVFTLEINTKIKPAENTSLEGFYMADNIFLTQCEAEGFRRITYFLDRPDVMSKYRVRIAADKKTCPILLSNGNLIDKGDLEDGRHFVFWEDPFRKPCYLFALVAGDFACIESSFKTISGRDIALKFYVDKADSDKCDHAITSLKKSMKWDEEVFGLEYDLDLYMIVATNAFNAGAMENKGLNIFNSKYVLARKETATDLDFQQIEGVIAHEYFHNWTGNRVTLNSWFQLSLKEGLTVFRDQEFSSDMGSRAIKRIADVRGLRASQFAEDTGPMAHPVRPESYIEMNNFYTATVYNKGAEIIRMIHTLTGGKKFRKGMDLYFERFDGKAVTTENFVKAMEDAANIDLSLFRLWYCQAGTPKITLKRTYDLNKHTYTIIFTQKISDTQGQKNKKPMLIPVKMGLIDKSGNDMPLLSERFSDEKAVGSERVLQLKKSIETFVFTDIYEEPVPSVFRGFSAPVIVEADYTDKEFMFLMANDSDTFNRWDAAQQLFFKTVLLLVKDICNGKTLYIDDGLIYAFRKTLLDKDLDKALITAALTIPTETEIGDKMDVIDVDGIHMAREFMLKEIAEKLKDEFKYVIEENRENSVYSIDSLSIAQRKLKNLAISYFSRVENENSDSFVYNEFQKAGNMTDEISALSILINMESELGEKAVDMFYDKWQKDTLVLDKWFSVQAVSNRLKVLEKVKKLSRHSAFSIKNPNKIRSLIGMFCQGNPVNFHQKDGEGYKFLADTVITLNKINPSIAARMVSLFNKWVSYDSCRQKLMKRELERISKTQDLSKGVYEIVTRALDMQTK